MKGDYSNGRIYKIEPIIEHEKHEVYYGSTTSLLCKRMDLHRSGYKRWKSGKRKKTMVYDLFDAYGVENCKIYLVQNFPCKNREELRAKEGEYIRNNVCVNKNVAGRTAKELRDKNKVQKSIYDKEFFKLNKSKILEYHKQYLKVKVSCICGVNHTRVSKSRHSKTKHHMNFMNRLNSTNMEVALGALNEMHKRLIKYQKIDYNSIFGLFNFKFI
jgi:hypothetical protein